jgi:hypothetical protein
MPPRLRIVAQRGRAHGRTARRAAGLAPIALWERSYAA